MQDRPGFKAKKKKKKLVDYIMLERKFTYVEMAFFQRWWNRISPEKQQIVKSLIQNGQLEINLGELNSFLEISIFLFQKKKRWNDHE